MTLAYDNSWFDNFGTHPLTMTQLRFIRFELFLVGPSWSVHIGLKHWKALAEPKFGYKAKYGEKKKILKLALSRG